MHVENQRKLLRNGYYGRILHWAELIYGPRPLVSGVVKNHQLLQRDSSQELSNKKGISIRPLFNKSS